jgi:hypothetical protein
VSASGGRYMASACWTIRSEHLCDFEFPSRCGKARLGTKRHGGSFPHRAHFRLNITLSCAAVYRTRVIGSGSSKLLSPPSRSRDTISPACVDAR